MWTVPVRANQCAITEISVMIRYRLLRIILYINNIYLTIMGVEFDFQKVFEVFGVHLVQI